VGLPFSFLAPWKFSHCLHTAISLLLLQINILYQSYLTTRVNQHPPVHQLDVLSIGWALFFHPVPDPVLTQHCTSQPFWAADLWLSFYLLGVFFFLTLTSLPSNLVTLIPSIHYWFTSWLYLLTPYLSTFYFSMAKLLSWLNLFLLKGSFNYSSLNLYLLTKPLPFGTTSNSYKLNLYLLAQLVTFLG
jgi:hypothetical protein